MDVVKITLEDIEKSFDGNKILDKISLSLKEGEFISIVGPSGSGKSTVFNIISRLIGADSGNVDVNGNLSYMYQNDLLLPHKSIIDNVSLPYVLKGESKKIARDKVKELFGVFGLSGYEMRFPDELSGGMKQRANFMRTFITSHDIMLLDEPFGSLDSITRYSMQEWLINLRKKIPTSILMITHDIDEALNLSDKIYVFSDKPAKVLKIIELTEQDKKNEEYIIHIKKEILDLLA